MVQIFKSITAREVFRRRPAIKQELCGGEFWSDGYYVATVRERANWKMVESYVQHQGYPKEDLQQLRLFYLFDAPSACCGVLYQWNFPNFSIEQCHKQNFEPTVFQFSEIFKPFHE